MKASPTARKKTKPPPLTLVSSNLDGEHPAVTNVPRSPSELPRECLPIRKRPLAIRQDLHAVKSPKSAGPNGLATAPYPFSPNDINRQGVVTAPSSPLSSRLSAATSSALTTVALTPSSATSMASAFAMPPSPLIAAQAAAAVAGLPPILPKSPFWPSSTASGAGGGFPTPPTDMKTAYPWNSPTLGVFSSPFALNSVTATHPHSPLPFPHNTSLLSPAPSSSYPSSTNSSREELPPVPVISDLDSKRR